MLSILVTKSDLKPSSGHVDLLRVRVDDASESCARGWRRSGHWETWRSIGGVRVFNNRFQGRRWSQSCNRFVIDDTVAMLVLLVLDVEHLHRLPRSVLRARIVDWRRGGQSVVGLLDDDLNDGLGLLQNDIFGLM